MKWYNKIWSYPIVIILVGMTWLIAPMFFLGDLIMDSLDKLSRLK